MISRRMGGARLAGRAALSAWALGFASLGLATVASSAPQPSAVQITAACAAGTTCTSFVISVTNSNPKPINGLTIAAVGDKVAAFALHGYPATACKLTTSANAVVCFPLALSPGATLTGSGRSGRRGALGAKFRVYTTTDSFATSLGQTVELASSSGRTGSAPVVLATNPAGGAGLLVGLGALVLVLAAGAFAALSYARRRRRPTECAAQHEALSGAEGALHYWHAAVAHLEHVGADATNQSLNEFPVPTDGARTALAAPQADHETVNVNASDLAAMLEKSVAGRDAALRFRDQCQLDLINCMAASGRATPLPVEPLVPVVRPSAPSDVAQRSRPDAD